MSIPEIPKTVLAVNMRVYKTLAGEKDGIIRALELMQERSRKDMKKVLRKGLGGYLHWEEIYNRC